MNEIWKSGFFKIDDNLWDNYGNDDLFDEYPIEGIDLTFGCPIRILRNDHWTEEIISLGKVFQE